MSKFEHNVISLANNNLYGREECRSLDVQAQKLNNLTSYQLMCRAGNAAWDLVSSRWPNAQKIIVVAGSGNNAGDGYVVAKLASQAGLEVLVLQIGENLSTTAKLAYQAMDNVQVLPFAKQLLSKAIIIDAIYGIGLHSKLDEPSLAAVQAINSLDEATVVSLDLPTGLDANSGTIHGDAIVADLTITFIGLKPGLFTGYAKDYCGEIVYSSLGLKLFPEVNPIGKLLNFSRETLPKLCHTSHKRNNGAVLIIGGHLYTGAVILAGMAALRCGAGLVTVANDNKASILACCPELICNEDPNFSDYDAIVIGPGLGKSDIAKKLFSKAIAANLPLVVDADALNILSEESYVSDNWILTPHPGEAARLVNTSSFDIQNDRLVAVKAIQQKYQGVVILKGSGSLVASANELHICSHGNPGMATAGMGDVLSGILGAFLALHLPIYEAALLGVSLHSYAADIAGKDGMRGLIASDLFPIIRKVLA